MTAKGAFEPVEYAVVEFRPDAWAQPLEILRVVPHGSLVNAGDPLVEFDTEKLDRAIADLKVELALGEKALEIARKEVPAAEALHPLEMAEAERQARVAAEDLARFLAVDKAAAEEQSRFTVRAAEERLKYAREELGQLERMYKDKDLTEETEEMILQRTRFDVVQAEQSLKRIMENSEETLLLSIPRREVEARRAAEKAAITLEKAKATLPMQLAQKKLALAKQEHERAESLRRLSELEADRAAATLRSPRAGMVYYGRFREGTWSTTAVAAKAVVGQVTPPGELDFTVLDPARLQFRAKLEEKDLHLLATGLAGRVEVTGYPDADVPVTLGPFLPVPRDAAFEGVFAVAAREGGPKLLPGMTGSVRCVVAKRPEAVTVPSSCVFRDDDGSRYVFTIGADGKPVKKPVKAGLSSGGRTEILEGIAAGDRVRPSKP
ncbi:MAG: HlyD family efflux transporter periplasmic adaptor subunit [Planctomycetes bacterium]|nr:HlyD family efflux transporter periplasmic adaptor subunit [Planctomycetota bacterium]